MQHKINKLNMKLKFKKEVKAYVAGLDYLFNIDTENCISAKNAKATIEYEVEIVHDNESIDNISVQVLGCLVTFDAVCEIDYLQPFEQRWFAEYGFTRENDMMQKKGINISIDASSIITQRTSLEDNAISPMRAEIEFEKNNNNITSIFF